MHVLMPYKLRNQALLACKDALEPLGHTCKLVSYEREETLCRQAKSFSADVILSSETAPLAHNTVAVPSVYLGAEFYCADRKLPDHCAAYWMAHSELSFSFMTNGAKQKRVFEIGIPLRSSLLHPVSRTFAVRSLGIGEDNVIFSLFADGVSPNEIKATVRACQAMCPGTKLLLWSSDAYRRVQYQSAFASLQTVYVPALEGSVPLLLAASDAVFTPAYASPVCAAARMGKIVILLHAASLRARRNAAFLDERGIAFCGKTAADNVSYACRLLSGVRLRRNMTDAQQKYIIPDAETRAVKNLEEILQS